MVIGFTGRKGTGKDTAAQYFVGKYGFTKVAYADVLKEAAAELPLPPLVELTALVLLM